MILCLSHRSFFFLYTSARGEIVDCQHKINKSSIAMIVRREYLQFYSDGGGGRRNVFSEWPAIFLTKTQRGLDPGDVSGNGSVHPAPTLYFFPFFFHTIVNFTNYSRWRVQEFRMGHAVNRNNRNLLYFKLTLN